MPDFALNKKDRDLLQSVITKVGLLPPKLFPPEEGKLPSSPGIYVAKPTSSIPSLSPDDPDVPGVQTCDIYQIVINDDTDDPEILAVEAFTLQTVYNLNQKEIPAEWTIVQQTKFGNWVVPIIKTTGLYEILDLGPTWDDTEKAYKIQGRVVPDETAVAEMFDIDAVEADTIVWLWFPRQWSWDNSFASGLQLYFEYQRVYVHVRNDRTEIINLVGDWDGHWQLVTTLTAIDGDMPPYTAAIVYNHTLTPDINKVDPGTDRKLNETSRQYADGETFFKFVLNGPIETDAVGVGTGDDTGPGGGAGTGTDNTGRLTTAVTEAKNSGAWGIIDETMLTKTVEANVFDENSPWGPAFGSWLLWPGLPGFKILGKSFTGVAPAKRLIYVTADIDSVYAARVITWDERPNDFLFRITANPTTPREGRVYDGTTQNSILYPDMEIEIYIPVPVWSTVGGYPRQPNLQIGDPIRYRAFYGALGHSGSPRLTFVAVGDYLDDAIGMVKMWTGAVANIPRGWALMNGTDNSVGTGSEGIGSGADLSGKFIVGYDPSDVRFDTIGKEGGGVLEAGNAIAAGTDLKNEIIPSYYTLAFIERVDNRSS